MLLNSWSIALSICTTFALILGCIAARTGMRVLRFWDISSDSSRQISLESEIWLSATLMEYGLGFQLLSLILLVLAADNFSSILVGAMCGTGSFTANVYGMPALLLKLAAIFFYGFWIVMHRLDISSERYPYVRLKYGYLLFIIPLLGFDAYLQTMYLVKLEPDIITSCCGVIFSTDQTDSQNLLGALPTSTLLFLFYGTAVIIFASGLYLLRKLKKIKLIISKWLVLVYSLFWAFFYPLSMIVITVVISSYIYAMPYHHCPFCILKPEYYGIGYPIFFSLIGSSFFGLCTGLSSLLPYRPDLVPTIKHFQRLSIRTSLWLLCIFLLICSYYPLIYIVFGGEL